MRSPRSSACRPTRSRSRRRRRTAATSDSPVSTSARMTRSITKADEQFGLLGPLHASGARVVVAEPEPERILEAITPRTRFSRSRTSSGRRAPFLPVHELKTNRPADPRRRAQSIGVFPVDAPGSTLHDLGPEVAVRAGGDGRARRREPERPGRAAELPRPAEPRERRRLRAEGRARAFRSEPDSDGVLRGVPGCAPAVPVLGVHTRGRTGGTLPFPLGRCRMRRRRAGAARDTRLVARACGRVGRRRREARGGGRDRA